MTRTSAALRCAVCAGFIAGFLGLAVAAALAAPPIALIMVELTSVTSVAAIVMVEMLPAVGRLRAVEANSADHLAIRKLRQELARLPETPHPLGM